MASVFQRSDRWYVKYKDATGRWCTRPTTTVTKTEAKHLASDLERRAERQRFGLEPLPGDDDTTLGDLLRWWEDAYFSHTSGYEKSRPSFHKHLVESDLAKLPLSQVTSGRIEIFIQAKTHELAAQTVNHLRGFLCRVFGAARRAGKVRDNPVLDVRRRRAPKRLPDYLRVDEVPRVLSAVSARWRPLFATAIYTGMRKGELLGLRKIDVDLARRLITVCRSYGRDTTKGGRAEAVPIASELVPYLKEGITQSPSELVFPKEDGAMMSMETPLEAVLRAALGRAGIVTGYRHTCRRQNCGHIERAADGELRRCPKCRMKLWPRALVRPIRFHDLRHTTASLLMMAGANPAAVQRILRHSDPRITTEVYGHLSPDYLRREIDLLAFGTPANDPIPAPVSDPKLDPLGAIVVQEPINASPARSGESENPLENQAVAAVSAAGFEPTTPGSGGRCSIQMSYAPELEGVHSLRPARAQAPRRGARRPVALAASVELPVGRPSLAGPTCAGLGVGAGLAGQAGFDRSKQSRSGELEYAAGHHAGSWVVRGAHNCDPQIGIGLGVPVGQRHTRGWD